mmetsp:Transcript_11384/g.26681  ORF Transcript_11384/g.26681 Transcript_11384/m.26681 type:complete len:236 (+) Transcript_11384:300-1007(+)
MSVRLISSSCSLSPDAAEAATAPTIPALRAASTSTSAPSPPPAEALRAASTAARITPGSTSSTIRLTVSAPAPTPATPPPAATSAMSLASSLGGLRKARWQSAGLAPSPTSLATPSQSTTNRPLAASLLMWGRMLSWRARVLEVVQKRLRSISLKDRFVPADAILAADGSAGDVSPTCPTLIRPRSERNLCILMRLPASPGTLRRIAVAVMCCCWFVLASSSIFSLVATYVDSDR